MRRSVRRRRPTGSPRCSGSTRSTAGSSSKREPTFANSRGCSRPSRRRLPPANGRPWALLVVIILLLTLFYVRSREGGGPAVIAATANTSANPFDRQSGAQAVQVSGGQPPAGREEQPQPIGQPAPLPANNGPYTYVATQANGKDPVAYDPCRPIHIVVNARTAPADGDRLFQKRPRRGERRNRTAVRHRRLDDRDPQRRSAHLSARPLSGSMGTGVGRVVRLVGVTESRRRHRGLRREQLVAVARRFGLRHRLRRPRWPRPPRHRSSRWRRGDPRDHRARARPPGRPRSRE